MNGKTRSDRAAPAPPAATIKRAVPSPKGLDITLGLRNESGRAVHYIADVRTLRYDPATRELVVGLSDSGRERLPVGVFRLPDFKYVDPGSEAELAIHIPERIVRLTTAAAPDGGPVFEEVRPAEALSVRVEVAWADTPYYEDPRQKDERLVPTAGWQHGHAVATAAVGDGKPPPKGGKRRR